MKFILALLTKAGKISRTLGYIYTGLLAATSALETVSNSLPDDKAKKINKIMKYLKIGADSLETVLNWLGKADLIEGAEEEARELTITDFQRTITEEIGEE